MNQWNYFIIILHASFWPPGIPGSTLEEHTNKCSGELKIQGKETILLSYLHKHYQDTVSLKLERQLASSECFCQQQFSKLYMFT